MSEGKQINASNDCAQSFTFGRIILDLCGGTGSWSQPYAEAGYDVRVIDPMADGCDVRVHEYMGDIHGILAAPPCTHLSGSGARWWADKGDAALMEALAVVDACMRIIATSNPVWWALENPVGRLRNYIGPPVMTFNPCHYGDPWTKRTLLWGNFTVPDKCPVEPTQGSKLWRLGPSPERAKLRSITPPGFARAFFKANP